MVVPENDPLDSFLNSIQVVKNAFSPIESNFRKIAKNFEHCFDGFVKNRNLHRTCNINIDPWDLSKSSQSVLTDSDDRKRENLPINIFVGIFAENCGNNDHNAFNFSLRGFEKWNVNLSKELFKENGSDNCLHFDLASSFLVKGFVQVFSSRLKAQKKGVQKISNEHSSCCDDSDLRVEVEHRVVSEIKPKELKTKARKELSFEYLLGFIFDQLRHFSKFDAGFQDHECKKADYEALTSLVNKSDHFRALISVLGCKKGYVDGFFGNLKFARLGGMLSSIVGVPSAKGVQEDTSNTVNQEDGGGNSPQKLENELLSSVPLSNVESLRLKLSTVSLTELMELLPQIGRPPKEDHPSKKKLSSVQDFFRYTEAEGKRFFQELDRDGDGQVTLEDLEIAMRKRKLPKRYANEFMKRARSNLFSKSFGWKQLLSLMEQKEPTILRAYTNLCLIKSGTLQKSELLASLENAGLPADEDNATAMMNFLNADTKESISYRHFRNFMLLLPSKRLQKEPRISSGTVDAVAVPPVKIPADSVLKSALAGGLSCALSATLMHPVDTVKTWMQASTLTFPEIISKFRQLGGVRGLYRGSIPAIVGQFSSHGLRTGICEVSKVVLVSVAPTLPQIQVHSVASFCGTFLGTVMRIPCEVLKQRLQAGLFENVGEATVGTWLVDGVKGFFRGTGATLCRELPFYVAGMGLYAESKKVAQQLLGRELEPLEAVIVGALAGGLTAVSTTPLDVIKTRMMIAPQGQQATFSIIVLSILRYEGPLGLFRGAVPRFFWVAPLGAMNFAGYELIRKAMG